MRVAALVALLLLLGGCTRWFFLPDARLVATPAELGYRYRDIAVETRDGVALHGWLIEPDASPARPGPSGSSGAPAGTVYFLHGNAENVSTHVRAVLWLVEAGYRVFALDYRGYGRSAGRPDIPEVFEDVRAGAAWLFAHLDAEGDAGPVHLFAQSLGASLAIRHLEREPAQRARFASLVVESAFTRYGAIARHLARGNPLSRPFGPLVERLLAGPDDPLDAIGALAPLPILVVHSRDDRIVPYAHALALHAAAGEPKAFLEARGPHVSAVLEPAARATILGFMRRHAGRGNGAGCRGKGARVRPALHILPAATAGTFPPAGPC